MDIKNIIFKGNIENYINRMGLKKLLKNLEIKDIVLLVNCKLKGFARIKLLDTLNILRVGHPLVYNDIKLLFTNDEWEYVTAEVKKNCIKKIEREKIKKEIFDL